MAQEAKETVYTCRCIPMCVNRIRARAPSAACSSNPRRTKPLARSEPTTTLERSLPLRGGFGRRGASEARPSRLATLTARDCQDGLDPPVDPCEAGVSSARATA